MKNLQWIIPFLVTALLQQVVHAQPLRSALPATGNRYALIIGISGYKDSTVPALKYAHRDAQAFMRWLQSDAGGNVPESHIRLLCNEAAEIGAIYNGLDWLKRIAGKGDRVYIYFAGHGDVETNHIKNAGYLLAYNSPRHNYRNNAISIDSLNKDAALLSVEKNAEVVLIADACHSGTLAGDYLRGRVLAREALLTILHREVRMASAATSQLAAEGIEWGGGRGVFSYYLLQGLFGFADRNQDNLIQLEELQQFLAGSMEADAVLKQRQHHQQPQTDGHPSLIFSTAAQAGREWYTAKEAVHQQSITSLDAFAVFRQLQPGLLDYFFNRLKQLPLEKLTRFNRYLSQPPGSFATLYVQHLIERQKEITIKESEGAIDCIDSDACYLFSSLDTLQLLQGALMGNAGLQQQFNEQFAALVHSRAQDMVNAYLQGDLEELERRQYYYSGNRDYGNTLAMVQVAIRLMPAAAHIVPLLRLQFQYLRGLQARLQMPFQRNTAALLQQAVAAQRVAMRMDPYTAYLHNEMGNLMVRQQRWDSALYHFNLSIELAPTWAIPWSNKARLFRLRKNFSKAQEAIRQAELLQPGLAFVAMNKGLIAMDAGDQLTALSSFHAAIAANPVHFMPFLQLGSLYLQLSNYEKAEFYFREAAYRRKLFEISPNAFVAGVELGAMPPGDALAAGMCHADSNVSQHAPALYHLVQGLRKIPAPVMPMIPELFDTANYIAQYTDRQMEPQLPLPRHDTAMATAVADLRAALHMQADIPLAAHYLAVYYTRKNQIDSAAYYLERIPPPVRHASILESMLWQKATPYDACLVTQARNYYYDPLEDSYLRAHLLLHQGDTANALVVYNEINLVENNRLMQQAAAIGGDSLLAFLQQKTGLSKEKIGLEVYIPMFHTPANNAAGIKIFQLLMAQKRFSDAEKFLITQMNTTRTAGNSRLSALRSGRIPYLFLPNFINEYFLTVNYFPEALLYEFYRQVILLNPRDPFMHVRAARYLHQRLLCSYEQLHPAMFAAFTEKLNYYAYPFYPGESQPGLPNSMHIPVTGELLTCSFDNFDPLKDALTWMQAGLALQQVDSPKAMDALTLADLYAWSGNTAHAAAWYRIWLQHATVDSSSLARVAAYFLHQGFYSDAAAVIQLMPPANRDRMIWENYTVMQMLQGNPPAQLFSGKLPAGISALDTALLQVRNLIYRKLPVSARYIRLLQQAEPPVIQIADLNDAQENGYDMLMQGAYAVTGFAMPTGDLWKQYTLARVMQLRGSSSSAVKLLDTLMANENFNWFETIKNDPVWKPLNSLTTWKRRLSLLEERLQQPLSPHPVLISYLYVLPPAVPAPPFKPDW